MDWNAYQEWTHTTAVYPDCGQGTSVARTYSCLGLVDEIGEAAGKLKKAIRGDGESSGFEALEIFRSGEKQLALRDELGDVLYYIARYCVEHGEKLSEIVATASKFVQKRTDLAAVVMQLASSAGALMDNGFEPIDCLADISMFLTEAAGCIGYTLEDIALANQEKLNSRRERGVLKGSGDKR